MDHLQQPSRDAEQRTALACTGLRRVADYAGLRRGESRRRRRRPGAAATGRHPRHGLSRLQRRREPERRRRDAAQRHGLHHERRAARRRGRRVVRRGPRLARRGGRRRAPGPGGRDAGTSASRSPGTTFGGPARRAEQRQLHDAARLRRRACTLATTRRISVASRCGREDLVYVCGDFFCNEVYYRTLRAARRGSVPLVPRRVRAPPVRGDAAPSARLRAWPTSSTLAGRGVRRDPRRALATAPMMIFFVTVPARPSGAGLQEEVASPGTFRGSSSARRACGRDARWAVARGI